MINMKYNLICSVVIFIFWTALDSTVAQEKKTHICYQAKICVHNGREKCGVNSNGEPRRFLDGCDIKEFNCLYKTDYVKANASNCDALPPISNTTLNSNHTNHLPEELTFSIDNIAVPDKAIEDIKNELTQVGGHSVEPNDRVTNDAGVKVKPTEKKGSEEKKKLKNY